jgi:hypothetical protein
MSLVVDALTVSGTFLLTVGTGSQAWAAQAEFRRLFDALSAAEETVTGREMVKVFGPVVYLLVDVEPADASESSSQRLLRRILTGARPVIRALGLVNPGMLLALRMYGPVLRWGTTLAKVRDGGGKNALELAQFFRQAIVWGMLTLGSALVLAGAVVTMIADLRGGG